jgi:hypothetical protein
MMLNGKHVSVVGVVTVLPVTIPGPAGIKLFWKFDVPFCLEYIELHPPREHCGWFAALEHLQALKLVSAGQRIGIIVDSSLGLINDFNERKRPVVGRAFLPENVQLIYASSDTSMDQVVNKSLAVPTLWLGKCSMGSKMVW